MNWRTISRNVGFALLVSALFMFLSVIVSMLNGNDSALAALSISFLITFISGIFPFIFVRKTSAISLKEGFTIITLSWLFSFIFGMLPYALWGGQFTIQNAWFESVSGFTTTGATILQNVEALPDSLLFWRSSTHFIGGLGVVVFLLLIIPGSSPIKMKLTNMELSSISKSNYKARSNKTVYIFAYVYLAICIAAFLLYLLAGMPAFDAICHAMSVCACGGFSTRNLSIAAFGSRSIELITMVMMLLASLHFGLLYLAVVNRSLKPLNNPVLKCYLACLLVFSVFVGVSLKACGAAETLGTAMWQGAFQTLSVASTTGFAITDNATWPLLPDFALMLAAVMCGCAGSTTGGLKVDRVLVLFKTIGRRIGNVLHPSSVNEVKLGKRILRDDEVAPQLVYIALYFVILAASCLIGLMIGMNDHDAFSAALASLSNVGPASRELGFMGNFGGIPSAAKFLYTFDMFLGRLEIYPVIAVVAMIFDGRKR